MTIKIRNRMNFCLFIISICALIANLSFFSYQYFYSPFPFIKTTEHSFLYDLFFSYQRGAVFISLFFLNLYVVLTSRVLFNAFSKTQGTEAAYMFCFLVACLAETSRFYIPLFSVEQTFSEFLIFLGRISVFARFLAPLSLLFSVIMSVTDQRQNVERNIILIIVFSMFISMVLPLNTAVLEKDFRVHAGFDSIVVFIEIVVDCLAVISLFFFNLRDNYSQKSTLGLAMLIAGFVININSFNYFLLVLGEAFYIAGTVFYLKEIHDRNLYD